MFAEIPENELTVESNWQQEEALCTLTLFVNGGLCNQTLQYMFNLSEAVPCSLQS